MDLVVGGAGALGILWAMSAGVGASLWGESQDVPWGALVVPVAGPFIAMAGSTKLDMGRFFLWPPLLISGLGQTAGLVMIIVGARPIRPKNQLAGLTLSEPLPPLKPELLFGPGSIGMRMHF